jgi:hypothetical protein
MKFILVGYFFIFSSLCLALETGPYKIVGNVKSFNTEFIVLDTGDAIVEIPRNIVKQPVASGKTLSLILLKEQKDRLKIKPKNN